MATDLQIAGGSPATVEADAVVLGLLPGTDDGPVRLAAGADELDAAFDGELAALLAVAGATGKADEVVKLPTRGAITRAAAGRGRAGQAGRSGADAPSAPSAEQVRRAAGAAARALAGTGARGQHAGPARPGRRGRGHAARRLHASPPTAAATATGARTRSGR